MSEELRTVWMQTSTGMKIYPNALMPEMINHHDIANGLSLTCRFSGQINSFYSVAEHSILLVEYVKKFYPGISNDRLLLAILLHDATEAYLGDLTTQVKRLCPDYKDLERVFHNVIFEKYDLTDTWKSNKAFISGIDTRILVNEKKALFNDPDMYWERLDDSDQLPGVMIRKYSPAVAKATWLNWFDTLTPEGYLEDLKSGSRDPLFIDEVENRDTLAGRDLCGARITPPSKDMLYCEECNIAWGTTASHKCPKGRTTTTFLTKS